MHPMSTKAEREATLLLRQPRDNLLAAALNLATDQDTIMKYWLSGFNDAAHQSLPYANSAWREYRSAFLHLEHLMEPLDPMNGLAEQILLLDLVNQLVDRALLQPGFEKIRESDAKAAFSPVKCKFKVVYRVVAFATALNTQFDRRIDAALRLEPITFQEALEEAERDIHLQEEVLKTRHKADLVVRGFLFRWNHWSKRSHKLDPHWSGCLSNYLDFPGFRRSWDEILWITQEESVLDQGR